VTIAAVTVVTDVNLHEMVASEQEYR